MDLDMDFKFSIVNGKLISFGGKPYEGSDCYIYTGKDYPRGQRGGYHEWEFVFEGEGNACLVLYEKMRDKVKRIVWGVRREYVDQLLEENPNLKYPSPPSVSCRRNP